MTTRTFTITLDDSDRSMILTALGFASMHLLAAANGSVEMRRPINELIARLSSANGHDAPIANNPRSFENEPKSGTEAARAVLAPSPDAEILRGTTAHDYFAADRKGNVPRNPPTGAELQTIPVVSAQEKPDAKGKHLQVIFGTGRGKANCFDPQLWPHIKKAQGHEAQLWIAESGNYLNIVGVRA